LQETWLSQNRPKAVLEQIDNVVQAVELVKSGRVDGILVDGAIASTLVSDHSELTLTVAADCADSEEGGTAMAFKKGSPLKNLVDAALQELDNSGELLALKKKWNLVSE
jgi:polar amino acid transport system substrate-binding protein